MYVKNTYIQNQNIMVFFLKHLKLKEGDAKCNLYGGKQYPQTIVLTKTRKNTHIQQQISR